MTHRFPVSVAPTITTTHEVVDLLWNMRGMIWDRNDVRVYHYDTNFIINQSLMTEVKYTFLKSINDMPINMTIRAMTKCEYPKMTYFWNANYKFSNKCISHNGSFIRHILYMYKNSIVYNIDVRIYYLLFKVTFKLLWV